jgi:hypothetical protein
LTRATRRRARLVRDGVEDGFVMIYVLMITAIVTVLVVSTLVVSSSAVIPAVRSGYNQAAYAAAQGGLAAFVAYADQQCKDAQSSVATCTLGTNFSGSTPIYTGTESNAYAASYVWDAQSVPLGGYFRVRSTGTVTQGALTVRRTLVADVAGGASNNLLDYGVVTGFETQSPDLILVDFPRRDISIDGAAATAAGVPVKGGKITWSGASPGVAAGKLAVCNATYTGKNGRASNPPPGAPNHYVDWSENGLQGNNYTDYQPCQTSFGHLTQLLAPANPADGAGGYFSEDALLLSNSYPGGTGPLFNQPVTTQYQYTSADGPCGTVGQNYRPFNLLCDGYPVDVGGSPAPTSKYAVQFGPGPSIPTNTPDISATACVYAGPTRVKLNSDGTAIISSPQTTQTWVLANAASRPAQCYAGANGSGMSVAAISLTTPLTIHSIYAQNHGTAPPTTPALAHGSSGWDTTGQKLGDTASTANSVFYLTSGTPSTSVVGYTVTGADKPYTPATGDNPSTKFTPPDGAWTPQWTTFGIGNTCDGSTALTDLKFFNCYVNAGSYSAAAYPTFKSTVQAALAANPGNYTTAPALQTYLNGLLAAGKSADGANSTPSNPDYRSHRWQVAVASDASTTDDCSPATGTPATTNTSVSAPTTDPFFASTSGNSAVTVATDTTCFTATVTLQVGTCNVALISCLLANYVWGNGTAVLGGGQSIAQFKSTFTVNKTTTGTVNTAGVSSFPSMADVTQYEIGTNGANGTDGPGDLFVEGTSANSLALIAQNDVIVTNNLTAADTTNQTLELIADNEFRIHHPVKCAVTTASAIATTYPGFCPNDITGLYNKVLADGARPDQQYTNLRPDLGNLSIHGVIFALGIPQSSITCPQPPQGGGVCGGEFTVDNYSRGDSVGTTTLGTLLIVGTLAMAHHGPAGEEWEIPDAVGQTSRPNSGYQLAVQYQNLKNAVTTLNLQSVVPGLQTSSTTSSLWHVVSVSAGTGS